MSLERITSETRILNSLGMPIMPGDGNRFVDPDGYTIFFTDSPQTITNRLLEEEIAVFGRETSKKKVGWLKGTMAASLMALGLIACNDTPTIPKPPPPVEYESISASVTATYTSISGSPENNVTNGRVEIEGNGISRTGLMGETIELGQAPKGEYKNFKITLTGDRVLKAIIDEVPLRGKSELATDLLDTSTFNMHVLNNWILVGDDSLNDKGYNKRWDYKGVLELSFNPDKPDGDRLKEDYVDQAIKAVLDIAGRSNGIITGVNINRYSNHARGPPPFGEGRAFYTTDPGTGVGNVVYPQSGDRVKAFVLLINHDRSMPSYVPGEVVDCFFQGNQNVSLYIDPVNTNNVLRAIEVSFKRPAGNDQNYRIFSDREERKGWPRNNESTIIYSSGERIVVPEQGFNINRFLREPGYDDRTRHERVISSPGLKRYERKR